VLLGTGRKRRRPRQVPLDENAEFHLSRSFCGPFGAGPLRATASLTRPRRLPGGLVARLGLPALCAFGAGARSGHGSLIRAGARLPGR